MPTEAEAASTREERSKDQDGGGGATAGPSKGGLVIKALCILGGAYVIRRLIKRDSGADHVRVVAQNLSGEKYSTEQAAQDPMAFFNIRLNSCPAADAPDNSKVLYYEQAFFSTPEKPYRQRFWKVKPCDKEQKCDVEVASYAVRDIEEYRNFCDRPKDQRPKEDAVISDVAEHLTTVYMSKCERGRRCLYEGSTPPGGYPNSYNGASRCTSEMEIHKNGEVHSWDRAYDDDDKQVWGPTQGPYIFKPKSSSLSSAPASAPSLSLNSSYSKA